MVDAWHNQCKVSQASDCRFKFFGGGCPCVEQVVDVRCPGDEFVVGKRDFEAVEIEFPTENHLDFGEAGLGK